MLRSVLELGRYTVAGLDGDAGRLLGFLLDEARWEVQGLVVQTWEQRRVVLPPGAVRFADDGQRLHVGLGIGRIKSGRGADQDVCRAEELRGSLLEGCDGVIGTIQDSLVDDQTWALCWLVVDTSAWSPVRRALVAPQWARRVSWEERKVVLGLPRRAIEDAPGWTPDAAVDRAYRAAVLRHPGPPPGKG